MKRLKRQFLRLFFILEIITFGYLYFFGTQGLQALQNLHQQKNSLSKELDLLTKEVNILKYELEQWDKNNSYKKEKIAREYLQMGYPAEEFYLYKPNSI